MKNNDKQCMALLLCGTLNNNATKGIIL